MAGMRVLSEDSDVTQVRPTTASDLISIDDCSVADNLWFTKRKYESNLDDEVCHSEGAVDLVRSFSDPNGFTNVKFFVNDIVETKLDEIILLVMDKGTLVQELSIGTLFQGLSLLKKLIWSIKDELPHKYQE
ncbi:hypothetical protein H5410_002998 [Solanum commersonii]|uniref:Uncharacterized protein n=1 Tax=Solanum commersonii TaxID=4109 RepID=A0A9J6B3J6_SOLCO|nr:hypothetical protein H5410_002998 [Solanum commersonii]